LQVQIRMNDALNRLLQPPRLRINGTARQSIGAAATGVGATAPHSASAVSTAINSLLRG